MVIRNCKRCDEVFNFVSSPYCPRCAEEVEGLYKAIKNYVYKNPDATVEKISSELGIEQELVFEMLHDGRLEWKPKEVAYCGICGEAISAGRLCQNCAGQLRGTSTGSSAPDRDRNMSFDKKNIGQFGKVGGMHTNFRKE